MPGMNAGQMRLFGVGAMAQIVRLVEPKMKQTVESYVKQQTKAGTSTIEVDADTDTQEGKSGVGLPSALAASKTALGASLSTLNQLTGQVPGQVPPQLPQQPVITAPKARESLDGDQQKQARIRSAVKTQVKKMMKDRLSKG